MDSQYFLALLVVAYSSWKVLFFPTEKEEDFPGSFTALFTRYVWLYRPVVIASAKIVILGQVFAKPSFVVSVVFPEVFREH